jgi:hypothetical protein
MRLSETRETVSRGLLDFAWRQWAQIGVSAGPGGDDGWAVDPEALVLFTIGVGRGDPRLFDEMLDWVALNHRLLSLQRLRNLTPRFAVDPDLVAAVAAWAKEPPADILAIDQDTGAAHREQERAGRQRPVFNPGVVGFVSQPDPVFAEHGYLRPRAARSGKSRPPDLRRPACFAFRLRQLFGPGSRSEVMRVLLTYRDGPLDAARIADEAAFAKRNASEALTALAAAGAVSATWWGNERHFRAPREPWQALLGTGETPRFVSWVHLLPAALEVGTWLEEHADTDASEYLLASQARSLMDKVSRDLQVAGVAIPDRNPARGAAYLPVFAAASDTILASMGTAKRHPTRKSPKPTGSPDD